MKSQAVSSSSSCSDGEAHLVVPSSRSGAVTRFSLRSHEVDSLLFLFLSSRDTRDDDRHGFPVRRRRRSAAALGARRRRSRRRPPPPSPPPPPPPPSAAADLQLHGHQLSATRGHVHVHLHLLSLAADTAASRFPTRSLTTTATTTTTAATEQHQRDDDVDKRAQQDRRQRQRRRSSSSPSSSSSNSGGGGGGAGQTRVRHPVAVENTPQNNECKLVEVKGAKLASFTVRDAELICLPQAFDLFLKHLVGGLHTVYTKLKRLDISPVVCNVEQVRVLRGLGAIQPGVNRCKLISVKDFEVLYNDCTNAR
ncbi:hypothetical protein CRUP_021554 [Coryphaenoides rupestris]|nr:hypothetical protein CRUP_021554 [Coryphaenoides rupestris]